MAEVSNACSRVTTPVRGDTPTSRGAHSGWFTLDLPDHVWRAMDRATAYETRRYLRAVRRMIEAELGNPEDPFNLTAASFWLTAKHTLARAFPGAA